MKAPQNTDFNQNKCYILLYIMLTKIQRFSFSFSLCFHFKHYLTLYEYLCMCSPRISSNMVILAYFLQLPLNKILCTKN